MRSDPSTSGPAWSSSPRTWWRIQLESYRSDYIDGENVEAVFDPPELEEGLAFRQSIPADLMSLLQKWARGFVPLNGIERSLSNLIDTRASHPVQRIAGVMTAGRRAGAAGAGGYPDRLHGFPVAVA